MREQALQEQEKKLTEERNRKEQFQQQQKISSAALRVPLHSLTVDVPPQVLQVITF